MAENRETLFECAGPNGSRTVCELRCLGDAAGWEVRLTDSVYGEFDALGWFALRDAAIQWAEDERDAIIGRARPGERLQQGLAT